MLSALYHISCYLVSLARDQVTKSIHATLVDLNYITVCMVSILGHHAIFFVGLFVASGRTIIIIEQERSVSIK